MIYNIKAAKADKTVMARATLLISLDSKRELTPDEEEEGEVMLVLLAGTLEAFIEGMRTLSITWMTPLSVKISVLTT